MQNTPLNAADFELIEDTLLQYGDDHSVLNPCELDGYFTALVSGPAQVDIAEWFPGIWGGENPAWETPEQCRQFIDLCVRHINTLAAQLTQAPQAFKARFEQTEHQGQNLLLAEEWCFGYLRGVAVGNWPEMPAPQVQALQLIIDCAEQDNFELPADLNLEQHRQQIAAIEPAARQLHAYWLAQR
ncbi:UPF0149 family protein [Pseudomonas sp. B21-059]|uniref:UPF0149 family protein n=1 Tax=Pseudomonas sp. B21-059 TaxID=2895496 RepID=UPI0022341BAF|nr:UPF0149 family protein [Pseudomonas sp. B21-059]UZE37469.1 UPF0149 family protein [Pseudomonas sp. B21-059]